MTLKTRWADAAMCDLPLPEYPRPQMVRDCWMNLNGFFDFAITDSKADWCDEFENCSYAQEDDPLHIPYSPETEQQVLEGLRRGTRDECVMRVHVTKGKIFAR